MLVIRLQRAGRKKLPHYRLVVAEKSKPVKGRFVAELGYYNALNKDLKFDQAATEKYLKNGAQPSQTVARLLAKNGVKAAEKFIDKRVMKPSKAEERKKEEEAKKAEEAKVAAEAAAKAKEEEAKKEKDTAEEKPEEKKESEPTEEKVEKSEKKEEDVVESK